MNKFCPHCPFERGITDGCFSRNGSFDENGNFTGDWLCTSYNWQDGSCDHQKNN